MLSKITKKMALVAAVAMAIGMSSNVNAALSMSTPNVVGAGQGLAGDGAGTIATQLGVGQQILDLVGLGVTTTIDGREYRTSTLFDYSGTLSLATAQKTDGGITSVPAGWEYVIGKYDGAEAGYVLFYLGGQAATLPATSADLWLNSAGQGYGLSNFVGFNPTPVPEPSTVVAGALLLLPFAASTMRFFRKNRKA